MNEQQTDDLPRVICAPGNALASALLEAQKAIGGVQRDAANSHHGYNYASAEAMIRESRAALHGAGLAFFVASWCFEPAATPGAKTVGRVCVRYNLCHAASGETHELFSSTPVVPDRGRPDDKAELAALTTNLGYVLRGLLLLPRGEFEIDQRPDVEDFRREGNHARQGVTAQATAHGQSDRDYDNNNEYAPAGGSSQPPVGRGPGVEEIVAEIDRLYTAGDLVGMHAIPGMCAHMLPVEKDAVIKHFNPRKIELQKRQRGEGASP